nr:hypothetical protein CFP56_09575 [Quercus suber]
MLTVLHLDYLQSDLQIHRILEHSDQSSAKMLLSISFDTITTVLQIGSNLNRAIFLRHDFPYIVLVYGLPSAVMLASALQSLITNTRQMPPGMSRSVLIRSLTVFVSHLESTYSPDKANYSMCMEAAKAITKILDDILDPSLATVPYSETLETPTTRQCSASATRDELGSGDSLAAQPIIVSADPVVPSPEAINMDDILNNFDLSNWATSFNWADLGGDWSTF